MSYETTGLDILKLCCDLVSQFGNPRKDNQSYLTNVHFSMSICNMEDLSFETSVN